MCISYYIIYIYYMYIYVRYTRITCLYSPSTHCSTGSAGRKPCKGWINAKKTKQHGHTHTKINDIVNLFCCCVAKKYLPIFRELQTGFLLGPSELMDFFSEQRCQVRQFCWRPKRAGHGHGRNGSNIETSSVYASL